MIFGDKFNVWEKKHKIWPNLHLLFDSRRWEEIGEQKKRRTLQNTILGDAVWIFVKIFVAAMVDRVEDKRDYIQVLWWCWDPAGGQTGEVLWSHWEDTFLHNGRIGPQKRCIRNALSEAHLRKRGKSDRIFSSQKQKMQLASWNMSLPSSCQHLPELSEIKISRTLKALT